MSEHEHPYSARFRYPDLIEKGRATVLRCPVHRSGNLVAPAGSTATCTVYDEDGAEVEAPAVVVTNQIATATLTAGATSSKGYAKNWRVEWALDLPDESELVRFTNEAALVRRILNPVITDLDLFAEYPALREMARSSDPSWQEAITSAWATLQRRLYNEGHYPWVIVSPSALADPHLHLALAIAFGGLQGGPGSGDDSFADMAKERRELYGSAWASVSWVYDEDQDGIADATDQRQGTPGTTFLVGTDVARRGWRR